MYYRIELFRCERSGFVTKEAICRASSAKEALAQIAYLFEEGWKVRGCTEGEQIADLLGDEASSLASMQKEKRRRIFNRKEIVTP